MSTIATILVGLAVAGALTAWVAAVVFYMQTVRAVSGDRGMLLLSIFAWPFAASRIKGAGAEHAARVNKALVAFIACVIVAIAAFSVAANLHRLAR